MILSKGQRWNDFLSNDARGINTNLQEKVLFMRCVAYMAQTKAKLLTCTIIEIDKSKKNIKNINRRLVQVREDLERRVTERTNELRNSHKQIRELTAQQESIRDQERKKIAREIHDELGQALTALNLDTNWIIRKLSEKERPLADKAQSMLDLITSTTEKVRNIVSDLRPAMLDELGLQAAMEWHIEQFQARTGIKCKALLSIGDKKLNEIYNNETFRIFQEALTNISRHAEATNVSVMLEINDDQLIMEIKDNGKGVEQIALDNNKGFGVTGMKERAHAIGATLDIQSKPGCGVTILFRLPLNDSV